MTDFDDYATKIWKNEQDVARDRLRWHTSGHHIKPGQLTIDDTIEDACEALDIIPEQLGIPASTEDWQNSYMDDSRMIAAMAKVIYGNLNQHGRYGFSSEPDWSVLAADYVKEESGSETHFRSYPK